MDKQELEKMRAKDMASFLPKRDNRCLDIETEKMVYKMGTEVVLYRLSDNWRIHPMIHPLPHVMQSHSHDFNGVVIYRYCTKNGRYKNGHVRVYIKELDRIVSVNNIFYYFDKKGDRK